MIISKLEPVWKIDNALIFIRRYQDKFKSLGYFLALAGGVLNRGDSLHDLDIIVLPLTETNNDEDKLLDFLVREFQAFDLDASGEYSMERLIYRSYSDARIIDWFIINETLNRAEK